MSAAQATWPVFTSKLIERMEIAERTMAFRFDRPTGWSFTAGQFVDITLLDPLETDAEGNVRGFSIASPPHEQTILIATRMRETSYKRVLARLELGTEVRIEGPFGDLRLHNNSQKPAVLLAGGIGVTPFRSMVLRAAQEKLPHRIVLFHSNNRPEDAPFLQELTDLGRKNPNYRYIPTMTAIKQSHSYWCGETETISPALFSKYLQATRGSDPCVANAIFYVAGPPGMVAGMCKALVDWEVSTDNIRTEDFAGY